MPEAVQVYPAVYPDDIIQHHPASARIGWNGYKKRPRPLMEGGGVLACRLKLREIQAERPADGFYVIEREGHFIAETLAQIVAREPGRAGKRRRRYPFSFHDLPHVLGEGAREGSWDRLFTAGHAHDAIRPHNDTWHSPQGRPIWV